MATFVNSAFTLKVLREYCAKNDFQIKQLICLQFLSDYLTLKSDNINAIFLAICCPHVYAAEIC